MLSVSITSLECSIRESVWLVLTLNNLGKLCLEKSIGNDDSKITGKIKRRITLSNGTGEYENDFIYFLKQKIGEEKKEPVPPVKIPSVHTKKEECPCCC